MFDPKQLFPKQRQPNKRSKLHLECPAKLHNWSCSINKPFHSQAATQRIHRNTTRTVTHHTQPAKSPKHDTQHPHNTRLKSHVYTSPPLSTFAAGAKAKFIGFEPAETRGRFLGVSVFLFKERGRLPRRAGRQTRGAEPWHEEAVRNRDLVATSTRYKLCRSSTAKDQIAR